MTDTNCYATYGGDDQDVKSVFPVDYSSCSSSGCMLRFYWLAFQGLDDATVWQVYSKLHALSRLVCSGLVADSRSLLCLI